MMILRNHGPIRFEIHAGLRHSLIRKCDHDFQCEGQINFVMDRKVLLTLGERKKIMTLPPQNPDTVNATLVRATARELFVLTGEDLEIILQVFDQDFKDWVDANDDFSVRYKHKIKIVLSEWQVCELVSFPPIILG